MLTIHAHEIQIDNDGDCTIRKSVVPEQGPFTVRILDDYECREIARVKAPVGAHVDGKWYLLLGGKDLAVKINASYC